MSLNLTAIEPIHAEVLAALHPYCFAEPWKTEAFTNLLQTPGTFGLLALENDIPAGFVVLRAAADEAEMLTIGIHPEHRRKGIAAKMLEAVNRAAAERGVASLFLEVAEDNPGAIAFYEQAGYEETGRRAKYYKRRRGDRVDALLLTKSV